MAGLLSFTREYCFLPWEIPHQDIILKTTMNLHDNVEMKCCSEWKVAGN